MAKKDSQNSTPKIGMNRNSHPAEIKNTDYTFALNANIQSVQGESDYIITNEPSNLKCSGFKDGYKVVKHFFDKVRNRTYFFLVNEDTGCSEIGMINMNFVLKPDEVVLKSCNCVLSVVIEDGLENIEQEGLCVYNTLISDYCEGLGSCTGCLDFSLQKPVTDVAIRHAKSGDELYFSQIGKPSRYIKLDYLSDYFTETDVCTGIKTLVCLKCDDIRVFNKFDFPCITAKNIQIGGNLPAGVYEVALAYSDSDGEELTDYIAYTGVITITDINNNIVSQPNLDYSTNQSISVEIGGLDLDYDFFKVLLLYRSGNEPIYQYIPYGVFSTSDTELTVSSLPSVPFDDRLTSKDFTRRRVQYLTTTGLESVGGYLFQHGLEAQRTINLQPVVSLMGGFVKWGVGKSLESLYQNGISSALYKTYNRDETYPLSIQFKMKGGHKTDNFLFIARPPEDSEIASMDTESLTYQSITENIDNCSEVARDKVWQYKNTATEEGKLLDCFAGEGQETEIVETTFTCESDTYTIEEGTLTEDILGNLATWINNNKDYIIESESEELEPIKEALTNYSLYEECIPEIGDECDLNTLILQSVDAVSVDSQIFEEVSIPVEEYGGVPIPEFCGVCEDFGGEINDCGMYTLPKANDPLVTAYLGANSTVYRKRPISNTTCSTAIEASNLNAGVGIGRHLVDYGSSITFNPLLTNIPASKVDLDFKPFLHRNASFFKVTFSSQQHIVAQLSALICGEEDGDDNSNNKVRVSVYTGCPTLTEIPSYSRIISDMTDLSDSNKIIVLDRNNLAPNTNEFYIVVDSPLRKVIHTKLTFGGNSGTASVTIDGSSYTATYNTDISTTVSDFYNTYKDVWKLDGIYSYTVSDEVVLTMTQDQYDTLVITNITGDLTVDEERQEDTFLLSPPCNCFAVYKRDVVYRTVLSYEGLSFILTNTYSAECSVINQEVSECNVIPYKYGKFSYTESTMRYPCNEELYDSSKLNIIVKDLPSKIRNDFQKYYTSGQSGGSFIMDENKSNFMDKPIRHYKFPDNNISPFMSAFSSNSALDNKSYKSLIYPIGFIIDNEVINAFLNVAVKNKLITQEERDLITGYEIYRGDRRGNKSIISKGLGFDMLSYTDASRKGATDTVTLIPNYPLNDSSTYDRLNGFNTVARTPLRNVFTFHSPDTHYNKPTLPSEVYIDGFQAGISLNTFAPMLQHPMYSVLGRRATILSSTLAGLELTADITQFTAEMITTASTGTWAPAAIAIAGVNVLLFSSVIPFKFNSYRYEWNKTFEELGTGYNHGYIGIAEGQYFKFQNNQVSDGFLRGAEIMTYLQPGLKTVTEETTGDRLYINNFNRESSVFFKIDTSTPFSYPANLYDNSRMNIPSSATGRIGAFDTARTFAPYVTIKQFLADQYGAVNSIQWLHTGYCGNLEDDNSCDIIFGGDTFITRYAPKRKFPFFTQTAYNQQASTPFKYSSYFNVNTGSKTNRGYLDYKTKIDTFGVGLSLPFVKSGFSLWDGSSWVTEDSNNEFYIKDEYKFLINYFGTPYFLVESEINGWLRTGGEQLKDQHYSQAEDIIDWIQEEYVPINTREEFRYNDIYSSQVHRQLSELLPVNYSKELWDKKDDLSNTVIYSKKDSGDVIKRSPWLNYSALDSYDFSKEYGDLVDVRGIESEQVLFRFTDGFIILGAVDSLRDKLTSSTSKLGIGGIFNERAFNFNKTDLGYAGTQHKEIESTPFGHIWVDAKRGKVHLLESGGKGQKELSLEMDKWFKEHLPFKILKYYPNVNVDRVYAGIGISMGWDDRTKRVFITKLDYIPKVFNLEYSEDVGFYTGELKCSDGYELVNGVCTKTDIVNKIPNGERLLLTNAGGVNHGFQPPNLYSMYTSDGAGIIDPTSPTGYSFQKLTNPFWTGNGNVADRLTTKFGKWISGTYFNNTWYGGSFIINVNYSKIYHIILAADNLFRLKVDGVTILTSDPLAIGAQNTLNPANYESQTFRQVHIYPVELSIGCHIITVEGLNEGGDAMFGAAIVDNTTQELINATSYDELNYVYTTENEDYLYVDEEISFTCPEGYQEKDDNICGECIKTEIDPDINFELVSLQDENYFEKAHFTIAYSFINEGWVSYYSFYPNYYNSYTDYFQTGINSNDETNGVWTHHPMISSYQVFYGKRYPFTIEYPLASKGVDGLVESVDFFLETRKYTNLYDFSNILAKGFNKAYIYNNFQNSGELHLNYENKNDMRQWRNFPKYSSDHIDILQSWNEGRWSFNYIYNHVKNEYSGIPIILNDNVAVNKTINGLAMDYTPKWKDRLRGDYSLVRLTQDEFSQYKMLFRLARFNKELYV